MAEVSRPPAPRLFLVDGYALIYRAFFALMQRPLTTSRGENTSIAWGVANFLKRLLNTHKPELLAWVHDSGATFRDELYPDYKATREKLPDACNISKRISNECEAHGLLVRPIGHLDVLSPPLVMTREDVDFVVETLRGAILKAAAELRNDGVI